MNPIFQERWN